MAGTRGLLRYKRSLMRRVVGGDVSTGETNKRRGAQTEDKGNLN